jgi:eukaryotic-like serine/threonine-protein kinase
MLGAAIGKFRIQARLGAGSFGESWQAAHEETGGRVTIKLFRQEISQSPIFLQAVEEARAISSVAHTSIARIYDANHLQNGQAYIIRDFVDGESLMQRIAYGRHSTTQLADIIEQTANALVAAAARGVIHCNVKPSNLFIVKDPDRASGERVVVVDFAQGKLITAFPTLGHPGYMAPELVPGVKPDWRIDAYALGCIAFELGCQRPVFLGDSWDTVRNKHIKDLPPNLRSFVPDASASLDRLIARMLEKNPMERPKKMQDIAKLFQLMVGYEAPLGETVKD